VEVEEDNQEQDCMMTRRFYVGIDPGLSGAVAVIDNKNKIVSIEDTPVVKVKKSKTRTLYLESRMADLLVAIGKQGVILMAGIENVHAMPKQGVTSMFSMGTGFGIWLGILAALGIPYTRIEPRAWKKNMGIESGSSKSASAVRAYQLYSTAPLIRPRSRVPSDGRADALLLAAHMLKLSKSK
jgi:crossover junction endodeoxyribonuclease RuvC